MGLKAFTSAPRRIRWSEVFCNTFRGINIHRHPSDIKDRVSIIEASRSDDSDFCHAMMTNYGFTEEQMHRAAERFKLGRSKSGKTIYWMIDDLGQCRDGHISPAVGEPVEPHPSTGSGAAAFEPETWVSTQFKHRYRDLVHLIPPTTHCFFGLHQVSLCDEPKPIGIVERERSAVILSELQPKLIWLAYAYPANCTIEQFAPLRGYKVTLYPRADPCADYYVSFLELANQIRDVYPDIDITVSAFLEDHASETQKVRNIDLVDFLFESL
jgi:hypothetical protein